MACSSYLATKVGCTTCLSTLQAKKVNVEVDKASLSSSSPSFIVCTTAAEFYMQAHNAIWDNIIDPNVALLCVACKPF